MPRYITKKLNFEDADYWAVVDTETGETVCTEPIKVFAYPETVFIKCEHDDGRARMERLARELELLATLRQLFKDPDEPVNGADLVDLVSMSLRDI